MSRLPAIETQTPAIAPQVRQPATRKLECNPMAGKATLAICGALLAAGWSLPASAQAAAETAVILSGTGQATGRASRSLGSAISGSIGAAANEIHATRNGGQAPTVRRRRAPSSAGHVIPPDADMLEGTDAPTYRLGNGSSIRVSGRLIQGAGTTCAENCTADAVRSGAAP